jgi:hypothetical protein
MSLTDAVLQARARRSYELGRVDVALRRSLLLTPVVLLPFTCCSDPAANLLTGVLLVAAVAWCLWRGEGWRLGVAPGLAAGAVPLLAPLLLHPTGHACRGGICLMPSSCLVAGLLGGVALGWFIRRLRERGPAAMLSASLVAGLTGSVGCLAYGLIGLGGMILGMAAGALPVLVVRRA